MTAPHVRPRRGFFSTIALIIDRFVELCTIVPYSLVALALRLVMARVFFLDGQSKIEGPSVLLQVADFSLPVVLPHGVRAETIQTFTSYGALPFAPNFAATFVSYCEFFLPIFLVLGFATRFSSLTLLVITIMIQYYVLPGALWTTHVYWAVILLVLMTCGAGAISTDQVIRYFYTRSTRKFDKPHAVAFGELPQPDAGTMIDDPHSSDGSAEKIVTQ